MVGAITSDLFYFFQCAIVLAHFVSVAYRSRVSCLWVCHLESEKHPGNQAWPPFYLYLHCKVLQFWTRPYSASITNQPVVDFTKVCWTVEHGCVAMVSTEEYLTLEVQAFPSLQARLATKHIACLVGYSMAAMVSVEQHLWLLSHQGLRQSLSLGCTCVSVWNF